MNDEPQQPHPPHDPNGRVNWHDLIAHDERVRKEHRETEERFMTALEKERATRRTEDVKLAGLIADHQSILDQQRGRAAVWALVFTNVLLAAGVAISLFVALS